MERIKKYKIYILFIIIMVLSIISVIIQNFDRNNSLKINSQEILDTKGKITIYITGEIKNPGVYSIHENSRMNNIIDIAGGLTENADINKLNLAKKIIDSEKIIIPKKQEETNNTNETITVDEKTNKVNINTADLTDLTKIPGIGPATATKIIEYRKNNNFESIEDIMEVPGIGEVKFNSIKDMISIE